MHSSRELRSSSFEITVDGGEVRLVDLFDGFGEHDRLGVVIRRPCGGVGASALITAAITAFYDLHRARGPDFFVYPDYFLFHVGRPLGDHARLDIWPSRKEVVVPENAEQVLEAINDRAITWIRKRASHACARAMAATGPGLTQSRHVWARSHPRSGAASSAPGRTSSRTGCPSRRTGESPLTRRSDCSRRSRLRRPAVDG